MRDTHDCWLLSHRPRESSQIILIVELRPGRNVVEYSTQNHKSEGSNPVTGSGREKRAKGRTVADILAANFAKVNKTEVSPGFWRHILKFEIDLGRIFWSQLDPGTRTKLVTLRQVQPERLVVQNEVSSVLVVT